MKQSSSPPAAPRLDRVAHPWLWALGILLVFVCLAAGYSLITPPFETPDEVHHYAFARHLSQGNGLPVLSADSTELWAHEGGQPPLYYAMAAALTGWIDQSDFPQLAVRNPRANIGNPLFPGNKNFMLYSGVWHPLAGSNLALHMGRWLSVLLGVWTLLSIYLLGRLAFPSSQVQPLLTLALAAAIPQMAFISGAFTNDALIIALSAATVYWLGRLVARDKAAAIRWWEWALLGVLLGLAMLSKLQAVGLAALAVAVTVYVVWLRGKPRTLLTAFVLVGLPVLAIAGWWYIRNMALYGDWTGASQVFALSGQRDDPLDLAGWWLEFRGVRYSFWGLFGWFNILLPEWFYRVADVVTLTALTGALFALIRRSPSVGAEPAGARRVLWLAAIWAALSFAMMVSLMVRATASQGRLLLPALGSLAILFTLGLEFWLRRLGAWARTALWAGLLGMLFGSSLYVLGVLLPASYRPDPPMASIPPDAQLLEFVYDDAEPLKLLAIRVAPGPYHPGDDVPITLFMQADQPLAHDYQLFVQLLDEQGIEVANVTTHPGWGRNPTSLWQPGAIYADTYPVQITGEINNHAPLLGRVYVGFIDPATSETERRPLLARNGAGEKVTPIGGAVTIYPSAPLTLTAADMTPVGAIFGDVIRLAGFAAPQTVHAGEEFTVTLLFQGVGIPATDYTGFVHLIDGEGRLAASFDRAPAGDRYPTHVWRADDHILSEFPLSAPPDLAPGDYQLWSGLYESESKGGVRLPITDGNGRETGDGQVLLGSIRVAPATR